MLTKKQAKALFDTLDDIRTPMMQGDNLAILFCSYFDDGEVNPDSDTGWSEMAENGYSEVIGAIKSHFIPVHQAFIALHERVERLTKALRELIDCTHNCEQELTEQLYQVDFCGESLPLTNARAILKETTHD